MLKLLKPTSSLSVNKPAFENREEWRVWKRSGPTVEGSRVGILSAKNRIRTSVLQDQHFLLRLAAAVHDGRQKSCSSGK